jgi:type IV secretion system protein VirD4
MSSNSFDPFGDATKFAKQSWSIWKWSYQAGRNWRARRERARIEAEYGPEVADAVEVAIRQGRDPEAVLERARRAQKEREEREALLANPPPIFGSAGWAAPAQLAPYLKDRTGFDTPSSILLGSYQADELTPPRFVHWDGDGHLLTLAPTRSGKAQTVIIPNLLRYRGSCVVLDPKGELYAATSAWRARHVGPVYRWAPFDAEGTLPNHGFNPLAGVRTEADARSLAEQLFPRDPRSPEFFTEDAVAFVTALILLVVHEVPEPQRNLAVVFKLASLPMAEFSAMIKNRMARSANPTVAAAAVNVMGKSGDRGLPNLRDTLNSKFSRWGAETLLASLRRHDFSFGALKDGPATVYLDVPFDLMQPYAAVLRVVLKAALDAMLHNPARPAVPVLFVLDEFLQLGPFLDFRNAIRTHAGAGVRLWFFLQDIAGIEEHYPDAGWKPFFNCSVRQFFGIDDPFTARLISADYLGSTTVAYKVTNAGNNISAGAGGGPDDRGNSSVSMSSGESVQFVARPLLTPDEVMGLLSGWVKDGERNGIVAMRGVPPYQVRLVVHGQSATCRERVGMWAG